MEPTPSTQFDTRNQLASIVSKLCAKKSQQNASLFTAFKAMVKRSKDRIALAYPLLLTQLQANSAYARLAALHLVHYLFTRSAYFRQLFLPDFVCLLKWTLGLQGHRLPPPTSLHRDLTQDALRLIAEWHSRFGHAYRLLDLGVGYLRHMHMLDRPLMQASRLRMAAQERRLDMSKYRLYLKSVQQWKDDAAQMGENVMQAESLIQLLVPRDLFAMSVERRDGVGGRGDGGKEVKIESTSSTTLEAAAENIEDHTDAVLNIKPQQPVTSFSRSSSLNDFGIVRPDYQLVIELRPSQLVPETQDNRILFDQLRECHKVLCQRHVPQVETWLHHLEAAAEHVEVPAEEQQVYLKQVASLLERMRHVKEKCRDLGIADGSARGEVFEETDSQAREEEGDDDDKMIPVSFVAWNEAE